MIIIIDQNVTRYSQRSSSFNRSRNSAKSTPKVPKKKQNSTTGVKKSISYSYLNIKAGKNPNYNSYEAFLKYVLRVNKFKSKTSFAQPFNKITQSAKSFIILLKILGYKIQ